LAFERKNCGESVELQKIGLNSQRQKSTRGTNPDYINRGGIGTDKPANSPWWKGKAVISGPGKWIPLKRDEIAGGEPTGKAAA